MKKTISYLYKILIVSIICAAFAACSDSDDTEIPEVPKVPEVPETPAGGIDKEYKISRCKILDITPTLTNSDNTSYQWTVDDPVANRTDSVLSTTKDVKFIALYPGHYELTLTILNGSKKETKKTSVIVEKEVQEYSSYITKVYDFLPAVGQFTNTMPEYESGDTKESMRVKAENSLKGNKGSGVSLGGYGGYVVFGFDHTIVNIPGKRDFRVRGNAFWAAANPNPSAPGRGGSCEPGIIMVAYDRNGNGVPDDDEWYEIAGSEYNKPETIKDYEITYYKPLNGNEATQFKWSDNNGVDEAYKVKNGYHPQNYFPEWITEDKIVFKGTLLKNNAVNEAEEGSEYDYWVLYSYAWGYADNAPNSDDESAIDIGWAVDRNGNRVNLPGVDFIKVYTGVNQEAGWLGEVSTEVSGAEDLHLLGLSIASKH